MLRLLQGIIHWRIMPRYHRSMLIPSRIDSTASKVISDFLTFAKLGLMVSLRVRLQRPCGQKDLHNVSGDRPASNSPA